MPYLIGYGILVSFLALKIQYATFESKKRNYFVLTSSWINLKFRIQILE